MSTTMMSGRTVSSLTPGYGMHSHSSETSQAEITRTCAKAKAYFSRAAHKRDRAGGRTELRTELADWLASRPADIFDEVADLVADYWSSDSMGDPFANMTVEEIFAAIEEERSQRDAFLFDEHDDFEDYLDDPYEPVSEEDVEPGSLAHEMAMLDRATTMTLEEAFEAGLRVTVKPSGYTYGRS